MIGHDRKGGELRGKGEQDEIADGAVDPLRGLGRREAPDHFNRKVRKRFRIKDKTERGEERKLKADIPNIQRIPDAHQRGHNEKRNDPGLPASNLAREKPKSAHDGGAHHRRLRADEEGIKEDHDHGNDRAAPRTKPAAEQGGEYSGDDGNVETRDGDDVRCTGIFEGLLNILWQACIHAEQDARQQRRFGVGKDAVNIFKRSFFEGIHGFENKITASFGKKSRFCDGHIGINIFRSQIITIGEFLVFGRRSQFAAQTQGLPIMIVLIRRDARQN